MHVIMPTARPWHSVDADSNRSCPVLCPQVAGWKVATSAAGHSVLRNEWKGKDEAAAAQLLARVQAVADQVR